MKRDITRVLYRTLQTLMPCGVHASLFRVGVCVLTILIADSAEGEQFRTNNPLKAFVTQEYPWGDDYFIHGTRDTYLFRCILTRKTDGFDGIALSEISIWGNHGGPWEIFRKSEKGDYVYTGTEAIVNTACLERCRPKNICRPVNANGSVGGQNNSLLHRRYGPVFSPVSALSVISAIIS